MYINLLLSNNKFSIPLFQCRFLRITKKHEPEEQENYPVKWNDFLSNDT